MRVYKKRLFFDLIMEDKVRPVCCYGCALEDINAVYNPQFPVYLRGIAISKKEGIVLPGFSEAGNDVAVSSIEHILKEGTELILDEHGKPADRPDDFNNHGINTRAAIYHGNPNSFEMMFVRNAFRNLGRFLQMNISPEERKHVIPAILVYDSLKVERFKPVEISLPHERDLRIESLMRIYLLTEQFNL